MHRHKKQTGGSGQFGEVLLRVEPSQENFEFVTGMSLAAPSATATSPPFKKASVAVMKEGILAGYPIPACTSLCYDGKEHPVDFKPIAFEIAGS